MRSTIKRGQKAPKVRIVKHRNAKRVVVSLLLATVGVVVYALAYQYTYQAKLENQYNQVQNELETKRKTLLQSSNDKAQLQKQVEELNKQKQELESQLQAKRNSATVYAQAEPSVPNVATVVNCGDNVYKQYIYQHESGCRTTARNSIGCLGIGQACPGSKILNACPDLNFECQDAWFSNYAIQRYGSWQGAYNFWVSHRWW